MNGFGTLVLIRHAKPVVLPALPPSQWPLTDESAVVSRRLAEWLRPFAVVHVATSQERKATATAALIGSTLSIPVLVMPGLEEQGGLEVPFLADAEAFDRAVQAHFARPDEVVFGQESATHAAIRFALAVTRVREIYPSGVLACVSHGRVLCAFLGHFAGVAPYPLWKQLRVPDAIVIDEQHRLRKAPSEVIGPGTITR